MALTRLSFDKVFFHPDRVAELVATGDCFPLQGIFGLTNSCSHHCVWCYPIAVGMDRESNYFVNTDQFKRFVSDCRRLGMKSLLLGGAGEPTMHPDFAEILHYIKEIGLDVGLYTHGYHLVEKKKSQAVLDHCTYVRVSLDAGTTETHNKLHGVKAHFEQILENVRSLVSNRKGHFPTIGIQFSVCNDNLHELPTCAKIAKQIGVDYMSIKPVYSDTVMQRGSFDLDRIKEIMAETELFASDEFKVYAKYEQFNAALTSTITNDGKEYGACLGSPFVLFAEGNGIVYLCCNSPREFGNYLEDSIEKIWKSLQRKQILQTIDLHKCPAGCHIHPLNKIIWSIHHPDTALHPNFL